jgi:NADPH-dependent glutamate synthase beta subunit-like oxidoreductase
VDKFSKYTEDRIDAICEECSIYDDLIIEAAEYEGKKVELNNPIRTSEVPSKKFKVYVKNEKGNVVVVRFGDPKMEIKRDDPARRKSFRARHNCADPGPKWKARYWSCYQWRAGANVDN